MRRQQHAHEGNLAAAAPPPSPFPLVNGLALLLAAATVGAIVAGTSFGTDQPAAQMPILSFAVAFLCLGIAFLWATSAAVRRGSSFAPSVADPQWPLWAAFAFGLGLRLALLGSQPILEADFNRYLWDGALLAHGFNPFALAPAEVRALGYDDLRLELSKVAGPVFDQISFPHLRTIYPPVAQAAFALAHVIAPWSLAAWRAVCLAADVMTFAAIVALLRACGRPPLWSLLYWWNPLVIKEIANSAHMEAILMPFVLGALLMSVRGRHLSGAALLGLAIGTKLWPMMLVPLILRPLAAAPVRLLAAITILMVIGAGCAIPIWAAGPGALTGGLSFATHWTTNSAQFPVLERAAVVALSPFAPSAPAVSLALRLMAALLALAIALRLAWRPVGDAGDLVGRAYWTITILLLLSPAQFPWYTLWVLPLAAVQPGRGWHVAAALMPLYYSAFHFRVAGDFTTYETYVVWVLWVPVWLALARDAWAHDRPVPVRPT
jgi:alpha-1,6-mannosyltransferase